MKKVGYIALMAAVALVSVALARPPYRAQAVTQFSLVGDKVGCTYCHVNANGGAPWNPFGEAVKSNLKGNISEALYTTLQAMKDSDGDGYADVLEVFAGTMPGNPDSRPLVTAEFLTNALAKAGGVDMYKPK